MLSLHVLASFFQSLIAQSTPRNELSVQVTDRNTSPLQNFVALLFAICLSVQH